MIGASLEGAGLLCMGHSRTCARLELGNDRDMGNAVHVSTPWVVAQREVEAARQQADEPLAAEASSHELHVAVGAPPFHWWVPG